MQRFHNRAILWQKRGSRTKTGSFQLDMGIYKGLESGHIDATSGGMPIDIGWQTFAEGLG